MTKFVKKPVVIEATRWFKNGDHPNDYINDRQGFDGEKMSSWSGEYARQHNWEGEVVRYYRVPHIPGDWPCSHCGKKMHDHGWIDTLEGGHVVCPGDWIITGVQSEHYPCKHSIFTQTYSPVDVDNWGLPTEIMDELMSCGILNESHRNNPRKALGDIIAWNCEVALDPAVSESARKLVERGRKFRFPKQYYESDESDSFGF